MGLRPLPHRAGADRRGHPRGVVADVGLRGDDVADQARPDVHGDGLSQPGLSGQGRCHRRHHLRRPGSDGHRRWLVPARVAGLRLRVPVRRCAAWHARRGCADHARRLAGRQGQPSTASTTRSTARSWRRNRCRTNGIPLWIAGGGEKVTLQDRGQVRAVHELHLRAGGLPAQVGGAGGALPRRRHRLRLHRAVGQLQRRGRFVRGRRQRPHRADPCPA